MPEAARESIGGAFIAAGRLPGPDAAALTELAGRGFYNGLQAGCLVAAGLCAAGALFTALALPAKPLDAADPSADPALTTSYELQVAIVEPEPGPGLIPSWPGRP